MTETKPAEVKTADTAPEAPSNYAAYDNTLLRFIGGVETSKAKANGSDAVKAAKEAGHDVEVRKV